MSVNDTLSRRWKHMLFNWCTDELTLIFIPKKLQYGLKEKIKGNGGINCCFAADESLPKEGDTKFNFNW